jgi:hypothetical protein
VPKLARILVKIRMVSTVCGGDRHEIAPTLRMSTNMSRWNLKVEKFSFNRLRPVMRYHARNIAPSV